MKRYQIVEPFQPRRKLQTFSRRERRRRWNWATRRDMAPVSTVLALLHSVVINRFLIKLFNTRNTHVHTHLTALYSGTTQVSRYQKGKTIWILLKQETVSGSGISWAICKSAPRSRQITTPAPHHSGFLQAGCTSCRPTNSVKALKAQATRK